MTLPKINVVMLSLVWLSKTKYKSWNVAFRRMFGPPMETHYYLVEPVSEQKHARTLMAKQFLNFVQAIRSSKKSSLRNLLKVIEFDCRSLTGYNLRSILLKSSADSVQQLKPHHVTGTFLREKSFVLGSSRRSLM